LIVSSAENPIELDKYLVSEYWSDVLTTHHAFLLDKEKEIHFLPGSKGGYVFSYTGDELKMIKAVEARNTRRATYIDYYLYVISEEKIIVLDENTWEKIGELELESERYPPSILE